MKKTGKDRGTPKARARWRVASLLQIAAACLFIGFISFALAFGVLGGHKAGTTSEADGASSASPGAGGESAAADGTTSASPGAAQPGSPDLLASASPGAAGATGVSPDLVTSPSTAAGGGGGGGTAPDLVTSPSTVTPEPSPTTPPDLVTSPSTPAPTPTTPPDSVTQPSPGTTPAPGTTPTPTTGDDEEEHPDTEEDSVLPPLALELLPLLAGAAGVSLLARAKLRRRK